MRRRWFSNEANDVHFSDQYFSITIVNKLLIEDSTLQLYAEPNKGIILNTYNHKTNIIFTFRPEKEIVYDFRDQDQQKKMVAAQFEGMRWRTAALQQELLQAESFF